MQRRWDDIDVDKYRKQAFEAAESAREAAERAADAASKAARTAKEWTGSAKEWTAPRAERAKDWAGPRVDHAKEWAAPRAEKAARSAARKASPYVHKAGDAAGHWVDVARGALVGAAIPAVVSAIDRAGEEEDDKHGGSTWAKVLIPVAIAGAAGAALVMWARRDRGRDDWAGDDDWEFAGDDGDFQAKLRRDVNRAADSRSGGGEEGGHCGGRCRWHRERQGGSRIREGAGTGNAVRRKGTRCRGDRSQEVGRAGSALRRQGQGRRQPLRGQGQGRRVRRQDGQGA